MALQGSHGKSKSFGPGPGPAPGPGPVDGRRGTHGLWAQGPLPHGPWALPHGPFIWGPIIPLRPYYSHMALLFLLSLLLLEL